MCGRWGVPARGGGRSERRRGGADRITPAATIGLVCAVFALLWANRLLPASMGEVRPDAEVAVMLSVWVGSLAIGLVVRSPGLQRGNPVFIEREDG